MAPRFPWTRRVAKGEVQRLPARTPAAIETAMAAQGMDNNVQLGPGRPINPAWGYSTRPRAMDYPAGVNIASGDNRGAWGRTSYDTLRGLINSYDVARACINHKIDELRSMEPMFQPVDGFSGDANSAIDAARAALAYPDRQDPYETWLSRWLEPVLKFDAGYLHKLRNYDGDVMALEVVDGTTIAPLLDQYGRRPTPPALAWEQVVKGLRTTGFTTDDLVPTIFRPQEDSPFGLAPIESVILLVNTDIRLQWHFLQMFTDGSIPAGFVSLPPDTSSPDQVDEWQQYWDSLMLGDQAKLHQLIAVPDATKLIETRPRTFDTAFADFLLMRTCAAFGVVPQDLGLVADVNRANGETQTDIQFRVNTLPWVRFVEGVLTRYLRKDLGLPVQVKLDTGRDVVDRAAEATAWSTAVNGGAVSVDEWRQEVYGLPIDNERPMPRFINSPRTGPVPLRSVFAIAGPIDPETGGPADDAPIGTVPFDGAGGVLPDKSPGGQQFKRAPIDPDDPQHPELEHEVPGSDVLGTVPGTKPVIDNPAEGAAVQAVQSQANPVTVAANKVDTEDVAKEATAGVTSATGIVGVDLVGAEDEDDEKLVNLTPDDIDPESGDGSYARHEVAKAAELASFRRFVKGRDKAGRWRDFTFTAIDETAAHALNQHARARVRKAAGQVVAAGLAVVAADTGRVLMLQRALDPTDPAGGTWEFPGGCLEDGESAPDAAIREWQEETGCQLPSGTSAGGWSSRTGPYEGLVWVTPSEADVPIFDRADGMNPDDPDGDAVEALAWWDPEQLAGNPAVRPELAADLDAVLTAIEAATPGKAPDPVAKSWRDGAAKAPQHEVDLRLVDYWAPRIADALGSLVTAGQLRAAIEAAASLVAKDATSDNRDRMVAAARAALPADPDPAAVEAVIRQTVADGYLAGGMAANRQLGVTVPKWDTWEPGDVDAAIRAADGGLADLLEQAGHGIKGITDSALDDLGNAIADGVLDGSPVDTIASSLSGWATGFRAERIAHTESARSVTAATLGVYQANGIDTFDVILSDDACDECVDVADNGPYPSGDDDDAPPIHPMCRCAASPHIDSSWTGGDDTGEDDSGE